MKNKEAMVLALANEIRMRKNEYDVPGSNVQAKQTIETIYFGGGTPSILARAEIDFLIDAVYQHYDVCDNPEITLEANPDDLSDERIAELAKSKVNRLSIGIQSFFENDLKIMNRAHNAEEAKQSLTEATKHFDNISIDLIYGIPGMSNEKWKRNIETALSFNIPHISSYALTVEPKTALKKLIQTGKIAEPKDDVANEHFQILAELLQSQGFIHYELSNFGKPDYFSRNNSAYWLGKKYIGIGPSAHSYDGISRSWNVSNNSIYIKSINENKRPNEVEVLSANDRYNEYVMTGLRTVWGISLNRINEEFGKGYLDYLLLEAKRFIDDGLLTLEGDILKTTKKGKFLTDGIASDLFLVNLD
jgi:oxygen-independent coproporphyrinogen III oxidase